MGRLRLALFVLAAAIGLVFAFGTPQVASAKEPVKKCLPNGKECKKGKNCKPKNCKKEEEPDDEPDDDDDDSGDVEDPE